MEPIAYLRSPYAEKFGVPRQAALAPHVVSEIRFEAAYRLPECVRGLEQFSHIWLIWGFHCNSGTPWRPTVRPPRLGGNTRMGVFATRSPFRPNGLGLSAVRLLSVELGPVLRVSGADMVDGTPIYDIKPYLPYADALPDANAGFTEHPWRLLQVRMPASAGIPAETLAAMRETLAQDPRPAYQDDPERVYHLVFKPYEIAFRVAGGVVCVESITPAP